MGRARLGRALARLVAALAVALWAPSALAVCWLTQATPMTFTNYSPFGAGDVATSDITFFCILGGTNRIGISTPRTMTSGANTLQFELYQEAGRVTVWPSAPPVPVGTSLLGNVTVRVYGLAPPQSNVAAGSYSTTLTVTLQSGNQTTTIDLVVSATVTPTCVIQPATLSFGSYDPLSTAPRDAQGTITVACTRSTSYTVGLDQGQNPQGATRRMASGANRLEYGLYRDAGRTNAWTTTGTVGGVAPSTAPIPLFVYGRIPEGQMAPPGDYADVVQATITF